MTWQDQTKSWLEFLTQSEFYHRPWNLSHNDKWASPFSRIPPKISLRGLLQRAKCSLTKKSRTARCSLNKTVRDQTKPLPTSSMCQVRVSPEISLELITRLLERWGNWLITFPLGRSVTGITLRHSVVSQPAPGITYTNLTPVARDINFECSGVTESGQDTGTFMPFTERQRRILERVAAWRSSCFSTSGGCVHEPEANCNPLQFGQPGTSLKQLFLDESSHSED